MGVMKRILEDQMFGREKSGPGLSFEPTIKKLPKTVNFEDFNNDVRTWGKNVASQLRQKIASSFSKGKTTSHTYKKGIHKGKSEKKLAGSIRAKFRKEPGGEQIETVAFTLERHGVFLQKGVGSGYVMSGGGVSRIAKSDDESGYRFKQDWFNSTLDNNVKELSNIITHHAGDAIVLNTKRMYIQ